MNLQRISRLLIVAVVPAIAGLLFTLQTNLDKDTAKIPLPPGIITPGEQDSGQLSIVPGEKDTTKIEYRNIVFSRDNALQSQGSAGNMVLGGRSLQLGAWLFAGNISLFRSRSVQRGE